MNNEKKLSDKELSMIKEYDHINEDTFSNHFILSAARGALGAAATYILAGSVILENTNTLKPVIDIVTKVVETPKAGTFLALGAAAIVGSIATYISYNSEKEKAEKLTQENSLLSEDKLIEKKLGVMKNINDMRIKAENKSKNNLGLGSKLVVASMLM